MHQRQHNIQHDNHVGATKCTASDLHLNLKCSGELMDIQQQTCVKFMIVTNLGRIECYL